jgi:IS5 family transposase
MTDPAPGRRRGRLRRAVNDLSGPLAAPRRIATQTPSAAVRSHPGWGDPAGQPAQPERASDRQGRLGGRSSSVKRPRSWTTTRASCSTTPRSAATPTTVRNWPRRQASSAAPSGAAHRHADRGLQRSRRRNALHEVGVRCVVSHGKADPARSAKSANTGAAFRRSARWRTGSEARIATLKRPYLKRPYLGPHPLDGLDKARIWSGHGVPAQNLVKIAALTA